MPKAAKDPNKPKRPLSAYLFYSGERRVELKEKSPNLKFGEFGKIIGKEWREMTDEEKKPFMEKAEKDKERYEKEMATYNP